MVREARQMYSIFFGKKGKIILYMTNAAGFYKAFILIKGKDSALWRRILSGKEMSGAPKSL